MKTITFRPDDDVREMLDEIRKAGVTMATVINAAVRKHIPGVTREISGRLERFHGKQPPSDAGRG